MARSYLFAILLIVAGFGVVRGQSKPSGIKPAYKVEYRGAMRDMFEKNDLKGKVDLTLFRDKPHVYALGPVEDLRGEILVWDSVPYVSQIREDALWVGTSFDYRAVFCVWARVAAWKEMPLPASIKTYDALEKFLPAEAKRQGLDVSKPFPFLLKGRPAQVKWHVIALTPDGTPHTREKHEAAKVPFETADEAVQMLGFYSEKHTGVFIHHTHRTLIHLRTADGKGLGHVDDLTFKPGMTFYLPK